MEECHPEGLQKTGYTDWSTEEADTAQDQSVWKYLSSQAACAEMREADW